MEHSWIGNDFVKTVEKQLSPRGKFNKSRVVWAGDYADGEKGLNYKDEDGRKRETNIYDLCTDDNELKPNVGKTEYRFVINHTKKQFVDKTKIPVSDTWTDDKGVTHEFRVHPLPLLTCEGNGRGGGDFRGEHKLIGEWKRDSISVANKAPKDYEEIIFDVKE